ncbi:hypothetical protein HAHE_24940 [Haloferula helveola]|uniref:HTH cro/C1-type domain-containing protein n=1 Tax=Haloferula helveola TaxID=490095 RepID=A0ABM7RAW2_9BACT|nr:hypothetical protein HAHE_24940 [Haloferula helveola]
MSSQIPEARSLKSHIREKMLSVGIPTQDALAARLDMSPSSLSRKLQALIEGRNSKGGFAQHLAAALEMEVDELLTPRAPKRAKGKSRLPAALEELVESSFEQGHSLKRSVIPGVAEVLRELDGSDTVILIFSELPDELAHADPEFLKALIEAMDRGIRIHFVVPAPVRDIANERREISLPLDSCWRAEIGCSSERLKPHVEQFIDFLHMHMEAAGRAGRAGKAQLWELPSHHQVFNALGKTICVHTRESYFAFQECAAGSVWAADDVRFLISLPQRRAQDLIGQLRLQLAIMASKLGHSLEDWQIPSYSGPPRWVMENVADLRDRSMHRPVLIDSGIHSRGGWSGMIHSAPA